MGNGASAPTAVRHACAAPHAHAQAAPRDDANKTRRQLRSKEAEAETRVRVWRLGRLNAQDAEISFIAGQVGVHSIPDRDRVKYAHALSALLTSQTSGHAILEE